MNTLEQAFATIAAANDLIVLAVQYADYGDGPSFGATAHWRDPSTETGQKCAAGYAPTIADALKNSLMLVHAKRSAVIPPALSETDMAALIAEDDRADRREAYWEQVNESLAYQMGNG